MVANHNVVVISHVVACIRLVAGVVLHRDVDFSHTGVALEEGVVRNLV